MTCSCNILANVIKQRWKVEDREGGVVNYIGSSNDWPRVTFNSKSQSKGSPIVVNGHDSGGKMGRFPEGTKVGMTDQSITYPYPCKKTEHMLPSPLFFIIQQNFVTSNVRASSLLSANHAVSRF